jgi:hypothetical protein
MDLFTREDLRELLGERTGVCLSLFLPTRRGGGEGDPVRWRRCLAQAEQALIERGLRGAQAREFLRPAARLLEEPAFWKGQCEGLAFFLAEGFQRGYRLPLHFEERTVVCRHFALTPLLPLVTGNGRFFVLALSKNHVRLLQATRDRVAGVELKGVPASLAEALARHDVDEPLTFHSHPAAGLGRKGVVFHGHGVGIDDAKDDLLLYFRAIERGLHRVLRGERAPLVLAAVDYLQPIFRQVCGYAHILPAGLEGCPDRLSDQELHERAWRLVEPAFHQEQERARSLFEQLDGTVWAADGVERVVPAACRGLVETLFVSADREVWGRFDPPPDEPILHEPAEPGDEELLNLAAVGTLRHGGTVHVLPADRMPGGSTLAGIFWLPLAHHTRVGR